MTQVDKTHIHLYAHGKASSFMSSKIKEKSMGALGTTAPASIQMLDASDERKSISFLVNILSDANFDDTLVDIDGLVTAIEGITLGNVSKVSYGATDVRNNTPPSNKSAQIETEVLVSLIDAATAQPFSFRIPTADYDAFNYASPPAADNVIISGAGASAATLAFVAAVNAVVRSPFNSANFGSVVGIRIVK